MKVTELKTGKLLDVNDSYGARLVEQGKAVPTQRQEKAAADGAKNKPGKKAVENPSTACAVPLPLTGEA